MNGAPDRTFLLEGTADVWEGSHKRVPLRCVLFSDVLVYYDGTVNAKSKLHKLGGVVTINAELKAMNVADNGKDKNVILLRCVPFLMNNE